jgi:hypothetical protein
VLECVDYRNYTPEICDAIGEFMSVGTPRRQCFNYPQNNP